MENLSRILIVFTSLLSIIGCETPIALRKDIFQGKPLWTSPVLNASPASMAPAATPPKIRRSEAPGLYFLVKQTLGPDDSSLEDTSPPAGIPDAPVLLPTSATNLPGVVAPAAVAPQSVAVAADENPLPPELAKLPATKAIVQSLKSAYLQIDVPETTLKSQDFRDLAETTFRTSLATYQFGDTGRLTKVAAFNGVLAPTPSVQPGSITWHALETAYFTAYYNGKFVDRTGGTLSKPTLSGLKISNDMITAALTVFFEATSDYVILQSHGPGSKAMINNPVVFTGTGGKVSYQTAGNARPTFVEVLITAATPSGQQPDFGSVPPTIPGVLEPLQTDGTKAGITQKKLDTIRLLSGYASDGAGSLSDLITRAFGGIHIGFIVMGKLSVGDNDTLSKIIQTTADLLAKRTTEDAVASYLYSRIQAAPAFAAAPPAAVPNVRDVADALGYTQLAQ